MASKEVTYDKISWYHLSAEAVGPAVICTDRNPGNCVVLVVVLFGVLQMKKVERLGHPLPSNTKCSKLETL